MEDEEYARVQKALERLMAPEVPEEQRSSIDMLLGVARELVMGHRYSACSGMAMSLESGSHLQFE